MQTHMCRVLNVLPAYASINVVDRAAPKSCNSIERVMLQGGLALQLFVDSCKFGLPLCAHACVCVCVIVCVCVCVCV